MTKCAKDSGHYHRIIIGQHTAWFGKAFAGLKHKSSPMRRGWRNADIRYRIAKWPWMKCQHHGILRAHLDLIIAEKQVGGEIRRTVDITKFHTAYDVAASCDKMIAHSGQRDIV